MILLNQSEKRIKLKCITESDNIFVKKEAANVSFISEEFTYYIYVDNGSTISKKRQITLGLKNALFQIKEDLDIYLDSFIDVLKEFDSKVVFNLLCDQISFISHKNVSYKIGTDKKENNYNLISKQDFTNELKRNLIKNKYTNYARDLQDFPPNIGTSHFYGNKILQDASLIPNLKVTVLKNKDLQELNMNLVLAVNKGSKIEANVVVLEFNNNPNGEKIGIIGKGICFDTGGYNLKPSSGIEGMKFDMSGAAITVATAMSLAEAQAKINFVAIGLFTDNRLGCSAILPDSIISSMNGLTVDINNTDAEGRLVLADGITYAIREKNVDRIIDVATLTGATAWTLGESASGVFTQNEEMWKDISKASQLTQERIWRLPIFEEHFDQVRNDSILADVTNSCNSGPGGSTAAAFLAIFAEDKPFLHIDCSRVVRAGLKGQGYLVKTLFETLNN